MMRFTPGQSLQGFNFFRHLRWIPWFRPLPDLAVSAISIQEKDHWVFIGC